MAEVFQKTGTVWENYAPKILAQGQPAAGDFVGWTGIGPITPLIGNVLGFRPDGARNTLTWNLRLTEPHGIKRLRFGTVTADLLYDGTSTISVTASAHFPLVINGKKFDVNQGACSIAVSHVPHS
jgi:hypothetical protein